MLKGNSFFSCFQNGKDQPSDKTEGEEETVSIDAQAAQWQKDGKHNQKLRGKR